MDDYDYVKNVGNYKPSPTASHSLSKYLLQLSNIEDVYLRNGSMRLKLSYNHIRHLFMVDEERFISEKNSPLIPETNYDVREVYKSIISYLITGIDDKEYHPKEKASVRKTRLNGKKEYLLEEIDKAKTKLISLGDSDAYEKAIEKEYANTCFKIKDIQNLIASKEQDSQRTANKVGELNLELTRINNEIDEVKPNVSQLKHVFSVAQRNMEKMFKCQELESFIKDKTADLQTLETLIKNCNSKSDSVEYFKEHMTKELLDEIKDTLNAWKYECDGIKNVSFDDKAFDIMIDGRTRTSYGKGNRSVSTAAVIISLFDYIHKKGACVF